MHILSYRGPASPGGVSGALSRLLQRSFAGRQQYWYLHGTTLREHHSKSEPPKDVCQIPFKIVEGHYRYCNEFLWPVMHELPEYATFDETNRLFYQQLNLSIAGNVMHAENPDEFTKCFINDYQLALTPNFFSNRESFVSTIFWHIPWPKMIEDEHVEPIVEIAKGILKAQQVGFHTNSYRNNFLDFVHNHVAGYTVDFEESKVFSDSTPHHVTDVVAQPLGLDFDYWKQKSAQESPICKAGNISHKINRPFVLSVDRADYTKGVYERLDAINQFFADYPERIGKISFVQVAQPTRPGLAAFDGYWTQCRNLAEEINHRYRKKNWNPIIWIDEPLSAKVLAWLYKRAEAMLITPLYDGLNLTAKEFVVCNKSGALILSDRAGVWQEIGKNAVTLDDLAPWAISQKIDQALKLDLKEKQARLEEMKETIYENTLEKWWQLFGGELNTEENVLRFSVKVHSPTKRGLRVARY